MIDWSIALAVGGMVGASIATAIGVGFWLASTILGLKIDFKDNLHTLELAFARDLSATRSGVFGRIDVLFNDLQETYDNLEKRVRAIEIEHSRGRGVSPVHQ